MTGRIIRFPARRRAVVLIMAADDGSWLVIAGSHGWAHGDVDDAFRDAQWLARNRDWPVRMVSQ